MCHLSWLLTLWPPNKCAITRNCHDNCGLSTAFRSRVSAGEWIDGRTDECDADGAPLRMSRYNLMISDCLIMQIHVKRLAAIYKRPSSWCRHLMNCPHYTFLLRSVASSWCCPGVVAQGDIYTIHSSRPHIDRSSIDNVTISSLIV